MRSEWSLIFRRCSVKRWRTASNLQARCDRSSGGLESGGFRQRPEAPLAGPRRGNLAFSSLHRQVGARNSIGALNLTQLTKVLHSGLNFPAWASLSAIDKRKECGGYGWVLLQCLFL